MTVAARLAGVELGGTKTIMTLGEGLNICEQRTIATTDPGETLRLAVEQLRVWNDAAPLDAIGLASFGPVRVNRAAADYGTMLDTPKPGWRGAKIIAPFADDFLCPIALDTDVNAAGIAEAERGAGRGCGTIVYLTIGTGVGGGVIVDGKPLTGRLHPEIGHLRLRRADGDGFGGACAFHGDCIEGLVSGPALRQRFGADPAGVDPADARWLPVASDLAELFAALMLTLSPERIIVGGSVALGQTHLLSRAADIAANRLVAYVADYDATALSCIVVPPLLMQDAGPIGALMLAARAASREPTGDTTGLRSSALRDSAAGTN